MLINIITKILLKVSFFCHLDHDNDISFKFTISDTFEQKYENDILTTRDKIQLKWPKSPIKTLLTA